MNQNQAVWHMVTWKLLWRSNFVPVHGYFQLNIIITVFHKFSTTAINAEKHPPSLLNELFANELIRFPKWKGIHEYGIKKRNLS